MYTGVTRVFLNRFNKFLNIVDPCVENNVSENLIKKKCAEKICGNNYLKQKFT